jgi:putative DNA primase/helicase
VPRLSLCHTDDSAPPAPTTHPVPAGTSDEPACAPRGTPARDDWADPRPEHSEYEGDHTLGDLPDWAPSPSANGTAGPPHDEPGSPEPPAVKVHEATDDPHRLARLFLADHAHEDGCTLHYWREEWHRWDGHAYRVVKDKEVRAELNRRIKREFDDINRRQVAAWEKAGPIGAKGKLTPPPVARKVTLRLVSDVGQALTGYSLLSGSLDAPVWLGGTEPFAPTEMLACHNTLVHLPSWAEGKPHVHHLTPAFFSPNALDYGFDPGAPPPTGWLRFLGEVWPNDSEAINTLQEWFGYCLLPDTRQQKILFIIGPKRSGKGTICRILRAMVGLQNTASPTLAGLGTNFGLWPLVGKTLATISDARLSGRNDVAQITERLLSISGEDAQTIDRKNLSPITTTLTVRFVILTNELPRLNDPSGALAGRMILLRQGLSWYGKEDTELTGRLLAELPGILLWALEGWKRLRARGRFIQPTSGRNMIEQLEDLSSPVGAFIRDRCEVGAGFEVPMSDLFGAWKSWCESTGRKDAGNEQVFGRDLRAAVPGLDDRQPRVCGHRVRYYVGIRLRDPEDQDHREGLIKTPF